MAKGLKIATIGGGSSYTPELIEGFIKRYDELPIRELWLVDIDLGKEKLQIVGELAKRMVEEAGVPMKIYLTLDRKTALKDADFVTTQFRVGLLEARMKDERIPLKYGVIGQETNGPGGLFKALRTIPVILDIVKDMEELCPNAWLVNFTNPTGILTEAILRYTKFRKVIGLCNVPKHIHMNIADMLGVEHNRVHIDFQGLNHMVYGTKVLLDGIDITKQVISEIARPKESMTMQNIKGMDWNPEFIEALGVIPCPYHRYYYKSKEMLEEELETSKTEGTRAEVVKKLEDDLFELYKDKNLNRKPEQLEKRGGAYYSDAACSLISSLYNNTGDIQPVNTMNNGAIASIPDDCAVEVSAVITKNGPIPLTMGDLPISVRGLVQQIKSFERLAAEAGVTGDYNTALLALCINPLVGSDYLAKQILDEMLEAHKEYLPQFFQTQR